MSSYAASWPSELSSSTTVPDFFESFYKISDTPDAHEKYAEQFTKDGTLVMVSKKVEGRSDILGLRKGMWEKVKSRHHKPAKIYPFGKDSSEVMIYGTVDYVFKTGQEVNGLQWSARAHLTEEDGQTKMDFYQVYLDSAQQQPK